MIILVALILGGAYAYCVVKLLLQLPATIIAWCGAWRDPAPWLNRYHDAEEVDSAICRAIQDRSTPRET